MHKDSWKPRGILNPAASDDKFQLMRYPPPAALALFIERYWIIRWDLRGEAPFTSETLPQPYVNLVFEAEQAHIHGVASKKYTKVLEGQGQVFGIKFRPGAIFPLLNAPLTTLTDKSIAAATLFGPSTSAVGQAILALNDPPTMIGMATELMLAHQPPLDETAKRAANMVDRIMHDRAMTQVTDVATAFGVSQRTVQRIFQFYVGVTPKWVITRYRLHDAAEQLASGDDVKLATMAQELGYFDQAHFINAFKATIGLSPTEYMRQADYAT